MNISNERYQALINNNSGIHLAKGHPYGLTTQELETLTGQEDLYDTFEVFDTIDDALLFIKEYYGEQYYLYAKDDSTESIQEEIDTKVYWEDNGKSNYFGYTSFDIGIDEDIEHFKNDDTPTFIWFTSGKVIRVELY